MAQGAVEVNLTSKCSHGIIFVIYEVFNLFNALMFKKKYHIEPN